MSAVCELEQHDFGEEGPHVLIPRAEVHVVARIGPMAEGGLDVHAFGARRQVKRKVIRRGQRAVTARLRLGASEGVLGVSAGEMADRVVPLEELWGVTAARRLREQLASARDVAAVLARALEQRFTRALGAHAQLASRAAPRLEHAQVRDVATDLGVSERHLRRAFHESVGVSPKTFAKLARFDRAVTAARSSAIPSWASIAVQAGYYDQAHLIAEFRAIAGVTPRALLSELVRVPA